MNAPSPYPLPQGERDNSSDTSQLGPKESIHSDPRVAEDEADLMAKMIINKLYALSIEYQIGFSALYQNFLINTGAKKKGFCYHYVSSLQTVLLKRPWKYFALHWGVAYDRSFLENNGLVITANGAPFESGIVVDSWRTASKPYWHAVSKDSYPWKELKDTVIDEGDY